MPITDTLHQLLDPATLGDVADDHDPASHLYTSGHSLKVWTNLLSAREILALSPQEHPSGALCH